MRRPLHLLLAAFLLGAGQVPIDDRGRLIDETLSTLEGTELARETYGHDKAGNRTHRERRYVDSTGEFVRITSEYEHAADNALDHERARAQLRVDLDAGDITAPTAAPGVGAGTTAVLFNDVTIASLDDPGQVLQEVFISLPHTTNVPDYAHAVGQGVTAWLDVDTSAPGGAPTELSSVILHFPTGSAADDQGVWHLEYLDAGSQWQRITCRTLLGGKETYGDIDGNGTYDGQGAIALVDYDHLAFDFEPISTTSLRICAFGGAATGPYFESVALTEIEIYRSSDASVAQDPTLADVSYQKDFFFDCQRSLATTSTAKDGPYQDPILEGCDYNEQRLLTQYVEEQSASGLGQGTTLKRIEHIYSPTRQRLAKLTRDLANPTQITGKEIFHWDGPTLSANEAAVDTLLGNDEIQGYKRYFSSGTDAFQVNRDIGGIYTWYLHDQVGTVTMEIQSRGREAVSTGDIPVDLYFGPGSSTVAVTAGPATPTLVASHVRRAFGTNYAEAEHGLDPVEWALGVPGLPTVGFQGRWHDNDMEMTYHRNRWYHPSTGRFLQRDPILHGGGANMFEFAGGNPVTGMDPLGLDDTFIRASGEAYWLIQKDDLNFEFVQVGWTTRVSLVRFLDEDAFFYYWEAGLFEALNAALGTCIDDYEEECVHSERVPLLLEALAVFASRRPDQDQAFLGRLRSLFATARYLRHPVHFVL